MADYAQQILEIQNKIFQVLRIKKQLESRRIEYLRVISSLTDRNQVMLYLNYLENTYKREERVYSICEKGLANALGILGEAKESVAKTQSFGKRVKNNLLGQMPKLGKKYKGSQSLIPLLNMMYSRLKEQIIFISANFRIILKILRVQISLHNYSCCANISRRCFMKRSSWKHLPCLNKLSLCKEALPPRLNL